MKSKSVIKRQNPDSKPKKAIKWKPASRLGTLKGPEGYRLRWCSDTPDNIARKKSEGWVILDKTKFPDLENSDYDHQVTDSSGLTKSVLKRNELVAMVMPEETALERTAYYEQETANRTQDALTHSQVKKLLAKGDPRNAKNVHSLNPEGVSVID